MKIASSGLGYTFIFVILLFCCGSQVIADIVDPDFDPQVETISFSRKWVTHVVATPDGKTYAAGNFDHYNGQPVGGLVRLNADASLDTTFDNDVLITLREGVIRDFILLPDGKFLLSGTFELTSGTSFDQTIVRFNSDGSIDPSFVLGTSGAIIDIALDSNGRIVAYGFNEVIINGNMVQKPVVRLHPNGSFDESFDFQPLAGGFSGLSTQNNKVLFVTYDFVALQYRLFRLNEDGSPDDSFTTTLVGGNGLFRLQTQADNKLLGLSPYRVIRINENGGIDNSFQPGSPFPLDARGMHLHADSRITIAHSIPTPFGMKIIRLLPNGSPDPTFNSYIFLGHDSPAHTVHADGSIIIGDRDGSGAPANRFTRLFPDGTVDSTFNSGGAGFQIIKPGKIMAISVLPDQKILIGGNFDRVNNTDRPRIARLNADSTLDNAFQINMSPIGNGFQAIDDIYHLVLQSDGRIIVSGDFVYRVGGVSKSNLVRLNADGSIDPSFNLSLHLNNHHVVSRLGTNKPAYLQNNKIVVGTTRTTTLEQMSVPLMLTPTGSKDSSFAPTIHSTTSSVTIYDLAVRPDQKIVIAGAYKNTTITQQTHRGFIARLHPNGTIDESFQADELVDANVMAISLAANGQIYFASRSNTTNTIARLNANGSIDTTFNAGIGADGWINAISLLPSERIVAGGAFATFNGLPRQNVAWLNSDGSVSESTTDTDREVMCITVDGNGRVLLGGRFTSISSGGKDISRSYLARFVEESQPDYRPLFDYDGDGKSDMSIFRPSTGTWHLSRSQTGYTAVTWGFASDKLAPADFDGDGKTDLAVFREADSTWYIINSTGTLSQVAWGIAGDLPVPADYDGDGRADVAVYRPSDGKWYVRQSGNGSMGVTHWGIPGDRPQVGDFDGDGRSDPAVFRPSEGVWYILRSSAGFTAMTWGFNTDKPAPADYDGDGATDIAVFRPSTGTWYVVNSSNNQTTQTTWGEAGDMPVPADYDGDGKADIGVYRPSEGMWYIIRSSLGMAYTHFGEAGDTPTPAAFNN